LDLPDVVSALLTYEAISGRPKLIMAWKHQWKRLLKEQDVDFCEQGIMETHPVVW
jgi:hypothetical protein